MHPQARPAFIVAIPKHPWIRNIPPRLAWPWWPWLVCWLVRIAENVLCFVIRDACAYDIVDTLFRKCFRYRRFYLVGHGKRIFTWRPCGARILGAHLIVEVAVLAVPFLCAAIKIRLHVKIAFALEIVAHGDVLKGCF